MRVGVALGLVGVLAIATMTACGGDDDDSGSGGAVSAEAQPYVDALKKSMTSDTEDGLQLTSSQADCMAPKFVDAIGVDQLKAKGITPEDMGDDSDTDLTELGLTEAQGNKLYDSFGACDVDIKDVFISGIGGDAELSDADRTCLDENFDDDLLKQVMVISLTKGDDALSSNEDLMGKVLGVFAKCPGAVPGS